LLKNGLLKPWPGLHPTRLVVGLEVEAREILGQIDIPGR